MSERRNRRRVGFTLIEVLMEILGLKRHRSRPLRGRFRFGVQGRCGFVKYEYVWIFEYRPGDGQTLPLTAG